MISGKTFFFATIGDDFFFFRTRVPLSGGATGRSFGLNDLCVMISPFRDMTSPQDLSQKSRLVIDASLLESFGDLDLQIAGRQTLSGSPQRDRRSVDVDLSC